MLILRADDPAALPAAVHALGAGQVVVVPTDTVYGLAAAPHHDEAVRGIFLAKQRPQDVHLPVLAASPGQVRDLGVDLGVLGGALADAWWPGPLTLALGFTGGSRPSWLDGRDEVAVRIPNAPFVLGVLAQTGPLLVTSANQHGSATPPSAEEAAEVLAPHVTVVIDGGTLVSAPSTLVKVRDGSAVVEREGAIPTEAIETTLAGGAMTKVLLAIETSCDETAAAVIAEDFEVRSSVVASQIDLHAAFGGVVPELASRAHVEVISTIVEHALSAAGVRGPDLEAIAVTSGPGLVGALLVGIATAKSLALGWGKPVVSVNHLEGHLASVFLADPAVAFPQTALLVSGGHCMLTRTPAVGRYALLGETVDDSIGEAYDKVARFLGLGYPGGPVLDRMAGSGRDTLDFPRPMLADGYSFSFSGLKTAVVTYVRKHPDFVIDDVAASFVGACMDVLIAKLRRALEEFGDPALAIVGGVAASPVLRTRAQALADEFGCTLLIPPQPLATDNAAMIGIAGWQKLKALGPSDPDFGPEPDLRLAFSAG